MDKIIIKGLKLFAYHGVNPEEKENGQNFIFDITMYVKRKKKRFNDSIESTVSYSKAVKLLRSIVVGNKFNLIETVAEEAARSLIYEFKDICKIKVELKKPEAPMKADFEYVSVRIKRTRSDYVG